MARDAGWVAGREMGAGATYGCGGTDAMGCGLGSWDAVRNNVEEMRSSAPRPSGRPSASPSVSKTVFTDVAR
jgi:hypothetical protein